MKRIILMLHSLDSALRKKLASFIVVCFITASLVAGSFFIFYYGWTELAFTIAFQSALAFAFLFISVVIYYEGR